MSSGGSAGSSVSQALGTLIHEIAQEAPDGTRAELAALLAQRVRRLGLGDGWVDRRVAERLDQMVGKLADYVVQARKGARELVAVEQDVQVRLGRAVVRGQVDRLERDAQGRLVVVDLKTGRSATPSGELARHAQLGVYQAAVEAGGFDAVAPGTPGSGGALLVELGTDAKRLAVREQPPHADDEDPRWAVRLVEEVAEGMAGAAFPAVHNGRCRVCPVRRSCPLQPEGRQVGG